MKNNNMALNTHTHTHIVGLKEIFLVQRNLLLLSATMFKILFIAGFVEVLPQ